MLRNCPSERSNGQLRSNRWMWWFGLRRQGYLAELARLGRRWGLAEVLRQRGLVGFAQGVERECLHAVDLKLAAVRVRHADTGVNETAGRAHVREADFLG